MSELQYDKNGRLIFTKEMRKNYKVLLPTMLPIHFELLKNVFINSGLDCELLSNSGPEAAETGLKYVHNDICYPAILVIGQFINALESGKYDVNKVALMITQTGGGCRASNYIHLLRKALKKAGFSQVPVISLNLSGFEKNSGFKLNLKIIRSCIASLVYGDLLMLLKNQTRPYELVCGESDKLVNTWVKNLVYQFKIRRGVSIKDIRKNAEAIISDFLKISVIKRPLIKAGVVGEIYVKYSELGNNNLEQFLLEEGCEVFVPGIMSFALFKIDNRLEDIKLYGGNKLKYLAMSVMMKYVKKLESIIIDSLSKYNRFIAPSDYDHLKSLVRGVIGYGNKMGEGWLLTAEMLELSEKGYNNIVCAQPFGCLPNHICGKGMIRKIRNINEKINIVAIDYDTSTPKVNQENRIKLMLSIAREHLKNNIFKENQDFLKEECKEEIKSFI